MTLANPVFRIKERNLIINGLMASTYTYLWEQLPRTRSRNSCSCFGINIGLSTASIFACICFGLNIEHRIMLSLDRNNPDSNISLLITSLSCIFTLFNFAHRLICVLLGNIQVTKSAVLPSNGLWYILGIAANFGPNNRCRL